MIRKTWKQACARLVVAAVCTGALAAQVSHRRSAAVGNLASDAPSRSAQSAITQALGRNQVQSAARLLQRALKEHPRWKEGWWQLGSLAYEQNDFLGGRAAFDQLAHLDPAAGAPWVMLGLCDFELRDFGLSMLHLQKGRALGFPMNPELSDVARYHQAADAIVLEQYEQAGLILNSFALEGHRSPEVIVAEGLAALHLPAIVPLFEKSSEPSYFHMVQEVGEAQYGAADRKPDQASAIYDRVTKEYPNVRGIHFAYGSLLTRWGEYQKGLTQFHEELKVDPDNAQAHTQIGYTLFKLGRFDQALPEARIAVRLAPGSFAPHFVLGQILVGQGKLEEGAKELETSRDLEPESSQVRYALAQAYLRLHRRDDAQREEAEFRRLRSIETAMLRTGTLPASMFEQGDAAHPPSTPVTRQ